MTVEVVTTLHVDGYNLYGKNSIPTWEQYFPADWSITYYAENHIPELSNRVKVINFNDTCSAWDSFYTATKLKLENDLSKDDKKTINWYKKALRWSFKMHAILHALQTSTARYLIWLDADVHATTSPNSTWIESCLDNKCLAAQLEFIKAGGHVETGILIFDMHHPDIPKIISWISEGYVDGKILDEAKAWDGIWMAKLLKTNTVSWNNLNMITSQRVAKAFSNPLLHWLTHKVGKRKFDNSKVNERSGRTLGQELI
jgi:hypothetical protein